MPLSRRAVLAAPLALAQPAPVDFGRRIRVAMIGTVGHPGEIISTLPKAKGVELAAIHDREPARAARMLRNPALASAKTYADYRQLLDAEKPDVVAVCNDNGHRAEVIVEAASRGHHVIAEKPIAITRPQLAAVRSAVEKSGVRLSSLLKMRDARASLAIRKLAREGALGEIVQIESQKSYRYAGQDEWKKRKATFGGTLPWIGIDLIDLMRWSSGREFTEVFALHARLGLPELGEMETSACALFRLDNGGQAVLRLDYLRTSGAPTHGDDRLRLAGNAGIAEYQMGTGLTLQLKDRKQTTVTDLPPEGGLFLDFLSSIYLNQPPALTAADVFRTCEIVLAAYDSAETRRPVAL
jgi:predicted dehydrogenase